MHTNATIMYTLKVRLGTLPGLPDGAYEAAEVRMDNGEQVTTFEGQEGALAGVREGDRIFVGDSPRYKFWAPATQLTPQAGGDTTSCTQ